MNATDHARLSIMLQFASGEIHILVKSCKSTKQPTDTLFNTVKEAAVGLATSMNVVQVDVGEKTYEVLRWKHVVYYNFLHLFSFVPRWWKNSLENFEECVSSSVFIGNCV